MTLTPGKLYLIRGGAIVRYQGPGYPAVGSEDFLREVTTSDSRFLRVRLVSLLSRKMVAEAAWVQEVMTEVGVTIHPYVVAKFAI